MELLPELRDWPVKTLNKEYHGIDCYILIFYSLEREEGGTTCASLKQRTNAKAAAHNAGKVIQKTTKLITYPKYRIQSLLANSVNAMFGWKRLVMCKDQLQSESRVKK